MSDAARVLRIPTARVFVPMLAPRRFKGLAGGRGSGKSHFFAEALVEECCTQHIRAACVREVQTSMKDSVKQLIEDKIHHHGLAPRFKMTEREIVGPHDSLIIFKGLQTHTASRMKSLEGFNRAWVEEAQTISQGSLDMMIPTFRKGSEMSFSWNPSSDKDPVDRLFSENKGDDDFAFVHAIYSDNPWFPDELRRDMERDRIRDYDKFLHVWMGEYQQNSEARVFRNWRIGTVELDMDAVRKGELVPLFGADWGGTVDPTVLVRCWIVGRTLYVDQEAYNVGCPINEKPSLFRLTEDRLVQDVRKWPITADSAWPDTISYMKGVGFNMVGAKKGADSVEEGVEFLKSYDIVVHKRCKRTIDELGHYSYKVDKKSQRVLPIFNDKDNHVIDALRYAVESTRTSTTGMIEYYRQEVASIVTPSGPQHGWSMPSQELPSCEHARMFAPPGFTTVYGMSGRMYQVEADGSMAVAPEDVGALRMQGFRGGEVVE